MKKLGKHWCNNIPNSPLFELLLFWWRVDNRSNPYCPIIFRTEEAKRWKSNNSSPLGLHCWSDSSLHATWPSILQPSILMSIEINSSKLNGARKGEKKPEQNFTSEKSNIIILFNKYLYLVEFHCLGEKPSIY